MRSRSSALWMVAAAVFLLPSAACAQQDAPETDAAASVSHYQDAIRSGRSAVDRNPDDRAARAALVQALIDVGEYEEAVEAAAGLPNLRGEALRAQGRTAEAEAAFREAIESAGPDRWMAEFNLAELIFNRGDRAEAVPRFDAFIDLYNRGSDLSSEDLTAVGNAVRYLGVTEPELFQDAVMAYDEAITADPTNIEPQIRLAELFLEKYNSTEAHTALEDASRINPHDPRVLLALARAHSFDGQRGRAMELVEQSLEINPNLVPARAFLARAYIDTETYDEAEAEIERALEVNPGSLDALSMLAALYFVRGDMGRYEAIKDQVSELDPMYAGLLTTVAEIAGQHRLYAEAADLAAEATRLDPLHWNAFAELGLNQFRLGRIDDARQTLERSFAGDPYNVWIKNNLDLLDTFEQYRVVNLEGFELMLHEDEADLLLPYLEIAARQSYSELAERYGDQSRGGVRLELYPRSADFSVRTVGLAGMGALGVSFGDVLALDSPSAREAGSYNWLTTLWHEMAHTIALGVSESRVPRWFTEGLSVHEERRARPGWGHPVTPEFLVVYERGELPPVSRLNEGFVRPASPQHLGHAYDMAALVAAFIEETRGFDAILQMLHGYRDGRLHEDIFRSVLGAELEEIDEEFDRWLRQTSDPADAVRFGALFTEGRQAFEAGDMAEARRAMEAAGELFPVAASGSPYAVLAQIHLRSGDEEAAIEALKVLTEFDETAYRPNLELAGLLEERGDLEGAAAALERAVWIYPYETEPHAKLAELYTGLGEHQLAVRERRALVGLRPTDRARAIYQLALALFEAGEMDAARAEILRALEEAPNFGDAQQLLLRIHEAS